MFQKRCKYLMKVRSSVHNWFSFILVNSLRDSITSVPVYTGSTAFELGAREGSWEPLVKERLDEEIKLVSLRWNQPWILIGRTDAEGEAPVLWSPDVNCWLIGKVPDAGKDGGQKEKRVSEDEMAEWHHSCTGHELGPTLGDGEGQGGLAYYSPWGYKELDMTGPLNNNNNKHLVICN